jgi:hypothetical protein
VPGRRRQFRFETDRVAKLLDLALHAGKQPVLLARIQRCCTSFLVGVTRLQQRVDDDIDVITILIPNSLQNAQLIGVYLQGTSTSTTNDLNPSLIFMAIIIAHQP